MSKQTAMIQAASKKLHSGFLPKNSPKHLLFKFPKEMELPKNKAITKQ
jgi:hypothetical protein